MRIWTTVHEDAFYTVVVRVISLGNFTKDAIGSFAVTELYLMKNFTFIILLVYTVWRYFYSDVIIYKLRVGNFLYELRVAFCELKIKITSCQSILQIASHYSRVKSYYSRVMSYFFRVENKITSCKLWLYITLKNIYKTLRGSQRFTACLISERFVNFKQL